MTRFHQNMPPVERVITRHNGLVFYGLAAASFLETTVPLHASRLLEIFAGDRDCCQWIEGNWWPNKLAHARQTRASVEEMWPEFDWSSAYGEFYDAYRPVVLLRNGSGPAGHEALARGVTAAQTAAFYRCLGATVDDAEVRLMLCGMSADESGHFDVFRRIYERTSRSGRLGWFAAYRMVRDCVRRARDIDVQLAFSCLGSRHWYGSAPFSELSYREFVARMGAVLRRHLSPGPTQRLMFGPWFKPRQLPALPSVAPGAGTCGSDRAPGARRGIAGGSPVAARI